MATYNVALLSGAAFTGDVSTTGKFTASTGGSVFTDNGAFALIARRAAAAPAIKWDWTGAGATSAYIELIAGGILRTQGGFTVQGVLSVTSNLSVSGTVTSSGKVTVPAGAGIQFGIENAGFSADAGTGRLLIGDYNTGTKGLAITYATGNAAFTAALTVTGGFGCNTKSAQGAFASGGAVSQTAGATYTATEQAMLGSLKTLANNIRTALVNNGIMS